MALVMQSGWQDETGLSKIGTSLILYVHGLNSFIDLVDVYGLQQIFGTKKDRRLAELIFGDGASAFNSRVK